VACRKPEVLMSILIFHSKTGNAIDFKITNCRRVSVCHRVTTYDHMIHFHQTFYEHFAIFLKQSKFSDESLNVPIN
jgi:hypothetical protein